MCQFADEIKTAVRELAERTFDEHSFEAYLLTECAYSQTEHEPLLKRRCGKVNRPHRHSERSVEIP